MNFIAKLVGKCFRYFMLFALILIGFESVNVFLEGQGSFFELLAALATRSSAAAARVYVMTKKSSISAPSPVTWSSSRSTSTRVLE